MTYGAVPFGSGSYASTEGAAPITVGAADFPFLSLEIAFASAPGALVPEWTDVTRYLRSVSTGTGRQRELDRYQAGQVAVVLDNRDRRFDPSYVDGPYAAGQVSQVLPMKRIRLRATYAGVTYSVFDAFVDSWDQRYEQPREAVAEVAATDGFKVLASADVRSVRPSELSGARVAAALDEGGWPANRRAIDLGASTLIAGTLSGSALEHLQLATDSEFGNLFMDAAGTVVFEGRGSLFNQANYGTFGDGVGELGYADIVWDFSDQLIRNDVTVTRTGGTPQRVEDAASITAYLRHSYTRDGLIHDSDLVSLSAAEFLVTQYKDPLLRVTSLDIAPRRSPSTLFPQVLGRGLTDRITVMRRPQGIGAAISQESVIEGITHEIDASQRSWRTSWQLSPAYVGCFIEFDDGYGSAPCGFDTFQFSF